MNESEDFTPSLVAGLIRYWKRVALVVALFGLLGGIYAWSSWKPQAVMTVNVQVANSAAIANANDADRVTSEVANLLSSPEVVDAAEEASGVVIDDVTTSWSAGESLVGVTIEASTPESSQDAAGALLDSFETVRAKQATDQAQPQIKQLNDNIATLTQQLQDNLAAQAGVTDGSAAAIRLQNERDSLTDQRNLQQGQLDAAKIAAATPSSSVTISSGPDAGPGHLTPLLRFVPSGMVVGMLISMAVVAVVERRRPWVTAPNDAARVMHAPLLGIGPRGNSERATGAHGRDQVAPVVAMSTLRVIGNSSTGIVLLVPRGAADIADGAIVLAREMTPVLERAGAKVAVLAVAASGRAFLMRPEGLEEEITGLWSEFSGRDEFEATLRQVGVDADLVVLVPVVDIEHDVLLDLILLSDVSVVVSRTGSVLEPLVTLRRDFDAIGREPHGVVTDLADA